MKTIDLTYPATPRIQTTVRPNGSTTYNEVFQHVFESINEKYLENTFKPMTWKEVRMLNFWRNTEHGRNDVNHVSGQFDSSLYERLKNARG